MKFFSMVLVFFLSSLSLWAGAKDLVIFYHGNTEVNREAIKFLQKELRQGGNSYNIKFVANPAAADPAQYKAVIILSNSQSLVTDPFFDSYLKTHKASGKVLLVHVQSQAGRLFVEPFTPKSRIDGVDGIATATAWGSNQTKDMHKRWVKQILELINRMPG